MRSAPSCTTRRSHSLRATGPSSTGHWGTSISGFGSLRFSARFPGLPERILSRVGFGLLPRMSAVLSGISFGSDAFKGLSVGRERGLPAGEGLPAPDRHIDVARIDLDGAAPSVGGLGSDQ